MYRRKVYVFGTTPNAQGEFLVAFGNHMERWTIDQVRTAWDRGFQLEQAKRTRWTLPVRAALV